MKQKNPHVHLDLYGYPGAGKSTFASTFDVCGPGFVAAFDGIGKTGPFHRRGDAIKRGETDNGIPFDDISYKGDLMWRVAYYTDADPEKPDAYALFRTEIRLFDPSKWGTFVLDSLTSMALSSYLEQRFVINKSDEGKYDDKKSLKWRSAMTDQLEFQLCRRFVSYECNVIVIAHVEEKEVTVPSKDGPVKVSKKVEVADESEDGRIQVVRTISAPGRLSKRSIVASQFGETYRAYVQRTKDGKRHWLLQTQPDNDWNAATQFDAPDPCEPTYEAIWKNHKNRKPNRS